MVIPDIVGEAASAPAIAHALKQTPSVARPQRVEYPGAVYHATCRGNDRDRIFLIDLDRELFLRTLERTRASSASSTGHRLAQSFGLRRTRPALPRRISSTDRRENKIATHLGAHYSTISRRLRQSEERRLRT